MSPTSEAPTEPIADRANRRKHARRKPDQLIYIDLGSSNGGFLLDVSENGLRFQGIRPMRDGQILEIKFKLPGAKTAIQAEAQFVRSGDSAKEAGLKLLNLPAEVQEQIRDWVALEDDGVDASATPTAKTERETSTGGVPAEAPLIPVDSHAEKMSSPAVVELNAAQGKPATSAPAANEKSGANHSTQKVHAGAVEKSAAGTAIVKAKAKTKAEKPAASAIPVKEVETKSAGVDTVAAAPPPELKSSAASRAANESASAVRQAVLRSKTVEQKIQGKNGQKSQFSAGLAAGCLVLVTIGGGLVVTGRVRLAAPSGVRSVSAASSPVDSQIGALELGNRHESIAMPGAVQTGTPLEQQPQTSQAATSDSDDATSVDVTPAPIAARPGGETDKPSSRRSRRAAGLMQIAMNRPVTGGNAAPSEASVQTPSLDGGAAPVPTFETRSPEPVRPPTVSVKQSNSPTAAGFPAPAPESAGQPKERKLGTATVSVTQSAGSSAAAFSGPEPEVVKQPKQPKPVTAVRLSGSTFSSPDSSAAGPSNIEPATLVAHSDPVYPEDARAANVQGSVDILATIGKDGVPRTLTPANGDSRLAAAAIAAISHWRYRPAMLNGQPEESLITITVTFAE